MGHAWGPAMKKTNIILAAISLVLLSGLYIGYYFTHSLAAKQLPLPQATTNIFAINDTDWDFKPLGAIPPEVSQPQIECGQENFCWLWDYQSLWVAHHSFYKWGLILRVAADEHILKAHFLSPQTGWVVKSTGVYQTQDGGDSWAEVSLPDLNSSNGRAGAVYFANQQVGWVVGGKYQTLQPSDPSVNNALSDDRKSILISYLGKTVDGGRTWQAQPIPRHIRRFYAIHFWNTQIGMAWGDAGGMITIDGGESWSDVLAQFRDKDTGEAKQLHSAFFLDTSNGWLSLSGGEIAVTKDGGKHWKTISDSTSNISKAIPDTLDFMIFTDKQHGLAIDLAGQLCKTANGGVKWAKINEGNIALTSWGNNNFGLLLNKHGLHSVNPHK